MHRRAFITSCLAAPAATVVVAAQPPPTNARTRALSALNAARRLEISGDVDKLRGTFHSDALRVTPELLRPSVGRAAIVDDTRGAQKERRPIYFYYRQPEVRVIGNTALVVSNYEAGYRSGDRTIEDTGKVVNVLMLGPTPPVIALDVQVPNIYAGGYGPLGTALTPTQFGIFPVRALGPAPTTAARTAGGGENDVLLRLVQEIHQAWIKGDTAEILRRSDRNGAYLIGDYSPFYVTGTEDLRQHFADFARTGTVSTLRELNPTVRIWGSVASIAFDFDLDYTVNKIARRSPGRAVYTFTQRGAPNMPWAMAACAATHLVVRNIGDPYPIPGA